jgi:hypothetical protein
MLGLFAFFYGCLHFTTYIWLDKFFDLAEMWKDVSKRPYITVGFLGFTLLIPLAVTSTAGWIRRLGGRRWQQSRAKPPGVDQMLVKDSSSDGGSLGLPSCSNFHEIRDRLIHAYLASSKN